MGQKVEEPKVCIKGGCGDTLPGVSNVGERQNSAPAKTENWEGRLLSMFLLKHVFIHDDAAFSFTGETPKHGYVM